MDIMQNTATIQETLSSRQIRSLALWGVAILVFGFGDTLTSILVFQQGGTEANVLFRSAITNLSPIIQAASRSNGLIAGMVAPVGIGVASFLLVKMMATMLAVTMARIQPRIEQGIASLVILIGLVLVGNNMVVYFGLR